MRAAVIGGGAYYAGKKVSQSQQHSAEQDAQIADMQQQQQAPQAAPATSEEDKMAQLKQLKDLLDTGVLTQAEFDAQKQKILQSM
jgi:membrane protease subunit (stomatin/prohibitin family)